jgi:hypothetical protein
MECQEMNYDQVGSDQATVFTSAAFCRLWAEVYDQKWHSFGAKNELGVIYSPSTRLGLRRYELSPSGLYWGSNQENIESSGSFLEKIIQLSHRWNCLSLDWNFRYDALKSREHALEQLGPSRCKITESYTHVLELNGFNYEQIEQRLVKALTRRQIRIGLNTGLTIREIKTKLDFDQHAYIYHIWADKKGIKPKPPQLIPKLASEMRTSTLFLGAFKQEKLLAAILVFRDQQEWFYWYGIRDILDDKYFATDVLLAYAIQKASENRVRFFNMGGSNQIKSLEFFKERWGAEKRPVWTLRWENPYWNLIRKMRRT